ncbi:MAG TPA: TetR/AcrR family transcriptional regulator [Victivallales bacterium]|nr:TetR/AcrR family transcriptional regulator [Victivallales bacterium]
MREETERKIIQSSIDLFSRYPYEYVSVVQICSNAAVSNGIFYNFFKSKEELFKSLLNETSDTIELHSRTISGQTVKERLESFINIHYLIFKHEHKLIKVYREGQYKFIEYEQKLREVYLKALNMVFNRELTELEYLFIISGIRYMNISFVKTNIKLDTGFLAEILTNGFFNKSDFNIASFRETDYYIRKLFSEENRKHKLLKNGRKLFGSKGFYKVKVNEIAEKTGVKVGGFYHYFSNKEQFLRDIITSIKNETIHFLKDNINVSFDNVSTHLQFLYLLQEYFKKAPYKYELIRESEFIAEDISTCYQEDLEKLFIENLNQLERSEDEKKIIACVLLGIAHYMGIEMFFTKNLIKENDFLVKMKYFFISGLNN